MPVPQNAMKDVHLIVKGISGFIMYWEKLCNACVIGESRRRYEHLVHYWRDVKIALEESLPNPIVLKDGFWPTTRVEANEEDQPQVNPSSDLKITKHHQSDPSNVLGILAF